MPILPSSGWLSGGGGSSKGGGSGDSGRSGGGGIFGGAFGIGKGGSEQRQNEGSRVMFSRVKAGGVKGTGPNNDARGMFSRSSGDKKEKEKKIPKGQEHKRSVTNKKDPRKLEKGETTVVGDSIVSRDPRGGFNIRHSDGTTEHRHTWEVF